MARLDESRVAVANGLETKAKIPDVTSITKNASEKYDALILIAAVSEMRFSDSP